MLTIILPEHSHKKSQSFLSNFCCFSPMFFIEPPMFRVKPLEYYVADVDDDLTMSCEGMGQPKPTILWRKVSFRNTLSPKTLNNREKKCFVAFLFFSLYFGNLKNTIIFRLYFSVVISFANFFLSLSLSHISALVSTFSFSPFPLVFSLYLCELFFCFFPSFSMSVC